jgi:copper chaperone CopZ
MKNITLNIKGMHCPNCEILIKDSLEESAGIKNAEISDNKGIAKISFDDTVISEKQIKSIINKEGYEVE